MRMTGLRVYRCPPALQAMHGVAAALALALGMTGLDGACGGPSGGETS